MEEYDAIIVGAGPAGGNCARELAKRGYAVLLVERSKIIGEPNFSSGGTVNDTMKVFNLPKKISDSPWSSILIAGPNEKAEFVYDKRMGYVLNYKLLKQFLANDAKKHGAEVITGVSADDLILNGHTAIGVVLKENGVVKRVFSKIVVDATGSNRALSKRIGLVKQNGKENLVSGLEYLMNSVEFEQSERLEFYLNNTFAPGGYSWIFPAGKRSAKVGIGIIKPKGPAKPLQLLKKFVSSSNQLSNATIKDLHGGSLFVNGGIKNHVYNGFITIGDAACQINPLGGEGIRPALYSGLFAAETIDLGLSERDVSRKHLQIYNQRWAGYIGNKWKISLVLASFVYSLSDNGFDGGIKLASKFDPYDIFEILFNYKFDVIKRYLPYIIRNVPKTLLKLGL